MSTRYIFVLLIFIQFIFPKFLFSQFNVSQMLDNGPTDNRINIVFLSEGYTTLEIDKFTDDATSILNTFLATSPLKEYKSYFNAYKIDVISNESGADHPRNANDESTCVGVCTEISRDTYFNSTYDSSGIHRLLTIPFEDAGKVRELLQNLFPEYDIVFIIVNYSLDGGSGGEFPVTSTSTNSIEIAIHEFGHSFAGLGDEYDAPADFPDIEEPNTTTEIRREFIKWKAWIDPSTPVPTEENPDLYGDVVGLFEGAHYHTQGWYRPKYDCKMNNLFVDFCEVCAETIVKEIYNIIDPIDLSFPDVELLKVTSDETVKFSVTTLSPSTHKLSFQWFINDSPLISETFSMFQFNSSTLSEGEHIVKVEVTDPTSLVRPNNILTSLRDWKLNVNNLTISSPEPFVTPTAIPTAFVTPITTSFVSPTAIPTAFVTPTVIPTVFVTPTEEPSVLTDLSVSPDHLPTSLRHKMVVAKATDQFGNGLAGITINTSTNGTVGTVVVSPDSDVTNADGVSTFSARFGFRTSGGSITFSAEGISATVTQD